MKLDDVILKNGFVMDPANQVRERTDVVIHKGKIKKIGREETGRQSRLSILRVVSLPRAGLTITPTCIRLSQTEFRLKPYVFLPASPQRWTQGAPDAVPMRKTAL